MIKPILAASAVLAYTAFALPARADSEAVVYSFRGGIADGANPEGTLVNVNNVLYGTTYNAGAHASGTVFSITPAGVETVLHAFGGFDDGAQPLGPMVNLNGTLYGTTRFGGTDNLGTVFSITTAGVETVLYSFTGGSDGAQPEGGLLALKGVLFGSTLVGGKGGQGTVFKVTLAGAEKIVYAFQGGTDGASPYGGVIFQKGSLFGTTHGGGANGDGTVFSLTLTGHETLLHSFAGTDGAAPYAALLNVAGTFYGTTEFSNASACAFASGCGGVFTITPSGTETTLHLFAGGSDGGFPLDTLTRQGRNLYGTTFGTATGAPPGHGSVFVVGPKGGIKTLYNFGGPPDAANPRGGLTWDQGAFYGVANDGGATNNGAVYRFVPY